jgi:endonuclease/exonuclease/phosphatase family metal-dependent hydrolase
MKLILLSIALLTTTIFSAQAKTRFASYNIRNFDYDQRSNTLTNKKQLIRTLENLNADMIAVQEINKKDKFIEMIEKNFNGEYKTVLTDCGGAHGQKLGFIYKVDTFKLIRFNEDLRTSNVNNPDQWTCNQGSRPLAVGTFKNLKTNDTIVTIAVHLKAGGRANSIKKRFKQHKVINTVLKEFKKKGLDKFVIMGDFNSTEYSLNGANQEQFIKNVAEMGVIDTTRQIKCSSYWWGGADDFTQYPSLLDHILISPELLNGQKPTVTAQAHCKKLSCEATLESEMGVNFDEVSDHCPLVSEIK